MGDPSTDKAPSATPTVDSQEHAGDKYEVPAYEEHSSFAALKGRIRHHYELASDYYYSLWGQHIHHAYFQSDSDTKETGQVNLINLLLSISQLSPNSTVLDVGCGIGGTTRHLARELGCTVTGITISGRQVAIANRITLEEKSSSSSSNSDSSSSGGSAGAGANADNLDAASFHQLGTLGGRVKYMELDAETMEAHFSPSTFDAVWISEALSHFPDKALFFRNAARVLRPGGKLVIADWFKAEEAELSEVAGGDDDIKLIEDGMLLPPLNTSSQYLSMAETAGLKALHPPKDISKDVARTWDISWQLVSSPSLWAFAISQGRDGLAFLQAFRAMRRGYANGAFHYAVMAFEKA